MRQEQQQIQRKTRRKRRVFIRSAMRGAEAAFSKLPAQVARQSRLVKMCEFSPRELHHLPNVLSAPRFATHLQTSENNREDDLRLYLWNLKICAALMVPLHIVEVNSTSELLESDPRRA